MAKVLVVESDEEVQSLLVNFLTGKGHVVIAESTAEAAQRTTETISPPSDIAIVTNWLEHQNRGAELTCWLKERFPKIVVILISGQLKEPEGHRADAFLPKPFNISQLEAIINQQLVA